MNQAPVAPEQDGIRVYRGTSVESLLPRIRQDLGADAVITCQRSGLVGGIAGFFQRPCVEIEARPAGTVSPALGRRGILAGDDDAIVVPPPGEPVPTRVAGYTTPVDDQPFPPLPDPFASMLAGAMGSDAAGSAGAAALHAPESVASVKAVAARAFPEHSATEPEAEERSGNALADTAHPTAPALRKAEQALAKNGLDDGLTTDVLTRVGAHTIHFATPRRLKSLVRAAVARQIPIAEPPVTTGRAIAFVGPRGAGKTLCAERFAGAYGGNGTTTTFVALAPGDGIDALGDRVMRSGAAFAATTRISEAKGHVAASGDGAVVVVDTPGTHVRQPEAIAALGDELRSIGVSEVHLVLPATMSLSAAEELLAAHAALAPTALVISHADGTRHHGSLVTLAIRHRLPISFLSHDPSEPDGLVPAEAGALAGGLLP